MELTILWYQNNCPPKRDEGIFEKVMTQAENFKKFFGDLSSRQSNNVVYQFQPKEYLFMIAESVPLYEVYERNKVYYKSFFYIGLYDNSR